MTRVVTLTLNPAIDETVMLDRLRPGHVHRASGVAFHPGGKGVNVASCLADWGQPVIATGILGRGNAGTFEALFAAKHITDAFLRVAGETRTNIKLSHDGETTDINLPGLKISSEDSARIFEQTVALADLDTLVVLGGSLPEGIAENIYAGLTMALQERGARVLLDTSGLPLTRALQATQLPYCIKPNRAELEFYAGCTLNSDESLIEAAHRLIARGVTLVAISLGADGALFVTAQAVLRAALPALRVTSTVGAGDAMVAGIIAALSENAGLEATARLATAFATAKLQQAGANLPARQIVETLCAQVQITKQGDDKP
ncbi:phosphofructokinase [Acidocella aquatica]|uniref:Phosphofructokinase n=1 Tax=Acidocella aquatica TaxID=1922313 RepID=A0ABQ6A3V0_9PROT|nr:1-phosphofructokinase [Acidocella aquatica]GLR65940.1 phosphofructokinase [Acidocella aquatica]